MRLVIRSLTLAIALGQASLVLAEYRFVAPPPSRHQGFSSSGRDVSARAPGFGTVEVSVSARRSRERTVIRVDGQHVEAGSGSGVLRLPPGVHGIELRLAGYRTHRERIRVWSGGTYRLRHRMEPLSAAAPPAEPKPKAC